MVQRALYFGSVGVDETLVAAGELVCRSLDDAPDGLLVVAPDGSCAAVNRRLLSWLAPRLTPEDVRGRAFVASWHDGLRAALDLATEGESTLLEVGSLPFSSGVGSWTLHVMPFSVDDRVLGATILVQDRTEQSRASQAFSSLVRRFRTLVDNASDGIAAYRDGILLYVNPAGARMSGNGRSEDLVGRPLADLILAGSDVGDRPATGRRVGSLVRRDGSRVRVELAASTATLGDGVVSFVLFNDLAQRPGVLEPGEPSGRMDSLGRLAGNVAHDFNNLLTGIRASLQVARRGSADPRVLGEALDRAEAASLRAAELVRQLLTFSRGPVGEVTATDPNPVVREAAGLLGTTAGKVSDIQVDLAEDTGLVWLAPSQVHQVALNLLLNAQEAVEVGGSIRVATGRARCEDRAGSWVVLTVQDDGCGMDGDTIARMFEPFFSTKSETGGTGLGLSSVYGIVRRAGGWIEVDSEPRRGTTFRVYFPAWTSDGAGAAAADGRPRRPDPDRDAAPRGAGCRTVLICDDEPTLAMLTAGLLESLGYRALTAPSASEALRLLGEDPDVSAVVLDVQLRPTPAGDLLEQMVDRGHDVRVILSSGFDRDDVPAGLLGHPLVVDYLAKPYVAADLDAVLRRSLGTDRPDGGSRSTAGGRSRDLH